MDKQRDWISWWTAVTALVAWVLANGLEIFSVFFSMQLGGQLGFVRYHQAEYFLLYAGMRMLGTLAVCLLVLFVSRRWPGTSKTVWSTLTFCALVTAVFAWWRLYRYG